MSDTCERHGRVRCGECREVEELKARIAAAEARLAAVATSEWDRITNERDEALRKLAETKELLGQGHAAIDAVLNVWWRD